MQGMVHFGSGMQALAEIVASLGFNLGGVEILLVLALMFTLFGANRAEEPRMDTDGH